jgi:hypothetical protein
MGPQARWTFIFPTRSQGRGMECIYRIAVRRAESQVKAGPWRGGSVRHGEQCKSILSTWFAEPNSVVLCKSADIPQGRQDSVIKGRRPIKVIYAK